MQELLQEYANSRGAAIRVDSQAGVIRGVKILGFESRNGRSYRLQALETARGLYEGVKVNVNHPKGSPLSPRDYQERIGAIRNVEVRVREGLFGDLHFNPRHALAPQLVWDAEHAPENVGFSHNVEARVVREEGKVLVEEIIKVQSVDLVADPATTRGLFEAAAGMPNRSAAASESDGRLPLADASLEDVQRCRPDLIQEALREQAQEMEQLRGELDCLRLGDASRQRRALVRRLLAEHGLPDADAQSSWAQSINSPQFLRSLYAANDERSVRELIQERAQLIEGARSWSECDAPLGRRPVAREQQMADAQQHEAGVAQFVQSITR